MSLSLMLVQYGQDNYHRFKLYYVRFSQYLNGFDITIYTYKKWDICFLNLSDEINIDQIAKLKKELYDNKHFMYYEMFDSDKFSYNMEIEQYFPHPIYDFKINKSLPYR